MSDKPAPGEQRAPKSKDSHASHSPSTGSSKKTGLLLAGAAVVALLLGGGYYVLQNGAPSQVASNNTSSAAPYAYDEVTGKDATPQTAEKGASATPITTGQAIAETQTAQPKKPRAAAAKVPEETIGVSRASARTNQTDELVVNGRRTIWRYTPTPERLSEYYPAYALERGREGEARLHCIVREKGKLDCERVSETPAKAGFGSAALQVAHSLRHADKRADGRNAIGTPLNLRVVFRMAEGERRRG